MTRWLRAARATGGLLTIATLLGLVVADVVHPSITLDPTNLTLLLAIVSALLGVDIITERLPVSIKVGKREEDE